MVSPFLCRFVSVSAMCGERANPHVFTRNMFVRRIHTSRTHWNQRPNPLQNSKKAEELLRAAQKSLEEASKSQIGRDMMSKYNTLMRRKDVNDAIERLKALRWKARTMLVEVKRKMANRGSTPGFTSSGNATFRRMSDSFSPLAIRSKLPPSLRPLWYRMENLMGKTPFPATWLIIWTNLLVFFMWRISEPKQFNPMTMRPESNSLISTEFMFKHFTLSWEGLTKGRFHTLATAQFSHNQLSHLLFNMLGMFFFARPLEMRIGSPALLSSYLLCGLVGCIAQVHQMRRHRRDRTASLGASGGYYGLATMLCLLDPWQPVLLYFVIKMPMIGVLALSAGYEFLYMHEPQVGHAAHIGGMLAGVALHWRRYGRFFF